MKNLLNNSNLFMALLSATLIFNACNSSTTNSSTDTTKLMKDTSSKGSSMSNQNLMRQDSQSVVTLITANYDEIKILQLALTKAIPADFKTDVKKMLSDHQKCLQQLNDLASKQTISAPTAADSAGVNEYNTLGKESGAAFEKDFLSFMISAHNDAISKCEDISKNSHNNDLVSWCNNTLPALHNHLQMMQAAQNKLNPS